MLVFLLILQSLLRVQCIPYLHTSVEIEDCGEAINSASKPGANIQCSGTTGQYQLGKEDQVIIHSVTYEKKTDITKTELCKKIASNNYDIKFSVASPKMKNVIYSDNGEYKAILTGTTDACLNGIVASNDVLKKGYLHVTTISCIPEDIAQKLKDTTNETDNKKFHKISGKICFLAPMLNENLETEVEIESTKYKLVVSAYPKKDCPICQSSATPKPDETSKKT